MKKIPTVYIRDPEDRRYVTDEVTPGCEWVIAGEALPYFPEQPGERMAGTYELIGPKVNGNPEQELQHRLIYHDAAECLDLSEDGEGPWSLDEIRHMIRWCEMHAWEGIVWHHPDGRMAKLKVRDYPTAAS